MHICLDCTMNYIQKTALFLGIAAASVGFPLISQAQTCVSSAQTPLTKARLDAIGAAQGIASAQIPLRFEDFARNTIRPGQPIPKNNNKYPSPERQARVGIANVVPDGVLPLVVIAPPSPPARYEESVFYEVKAVKNTYLPPSYEQHQIRGFLDALSRSNAARAEEVPAIIFLTTADINKISARTSFIATTKGVSVWHAIACEIPSAPSSNNLQLGTAVLTNPLVYVGKLAGGKLRIPGPIGPGGSGGL